MATKKELKMDELGKVIGGVGLLEKATPITSNDANQRRIDELFQAVINATDPQEQALAMSRYREYLVELESLS